MPEAISNCPAFAKSERDTAVFVSLSFRVRALRGRVSALLPAQCGCALAKLRGPLWCPARLPRTDCAFGKVLAIPFAYFGVSALCCGGATRI